MRWEVILPEVDSRIVPAVVSEEGQRLESQTISLNDRKRLVIQPPEKPGIYQIRDGARLIAKTVVNIDPRESDFRRIAPETLVEVLGGEAGRAQVVKDSGRVMDEGEKPLWPTAALCAALFLLAEMLVLAVWGRPRGRVTQ